MVATRTVGADIARCGGEDGLDVANDERRTAAGQADALAIPELGGPRIHSSLAPTADGGNYHALLLEFWHYRAAPRAMAVVGYGGEGVAWAEQRLSLSDGCCGSMSDEARVKLATERPAR